MSERMDGETAARFLRESAKYFRQRPTNGEDSAWWANVTNAENCEKIAAYIETAEAALKSAESFIAYLLTHAPEEPDENNVLFQIRGARAGTKGGANG